MKIFFRKLHKGIPFVKVFKGIDRLFRLEQGSYTEQVYLSRKKKVGTSGRPKLGSEGEYYINDVSFHRPDIGSIDQQTSAETVGQPAENPLVFLMLKGELHFGSAVGLQPF